MREYGYRQGFSVLEALIAMGILAIVSTALFLAYSNTLDIVTAGQYHSAAANLIESQIEIVRNMDYEDIGTISGVPTGKLPAQQTVTLDEIDFTINIFVRNIDDPFDGVLGGSPNDTAPADYKLVEIQAECPACPRFGLIRSSTTVAPRNLESADGSGNLFIQVIDADGFDIAGADVTVVNNAITPPIQLSDVTGANGMLQLVGVATSAAGYEVTVTKTGHSTEQTYVPGEPSNPNPIKPHITVATEQLTVSTFAIDETSTMTVRTIDELCGPVSDVDFLLSGGKLIGTSPDVPKYSANHTSGGGGSVTIPDLEWDSYSIVATDAMYEVAGTNTSSPVIVDPNTTTNVDWLVVPKNASALLVSVVDDQGLPVDDASVRLEGTGYDATLVTGLYGWVQTDWSGSQYSQQSGGIDDSVAGVLTLAPQGGPYATSSYAWLESNTIDFNASGTTLLTIMYNPSSQPASTGGNSVRFQLAANNDNSTWNFIGPDGTAGTFFTTSSASLPAALSGNQFLRYRVEMRTEDENASPSLDDIAISYRAQCLPAGRAHFNGLNPGTYTLTVTKSGFQDFTDTGVQVNTDWQEYNVPLAP